MPPGSGAFDSLVGGSLNCTSKACVAVRITEFEASDGSILRFLAFVVVVLLRWTVLWRTFVQDGGGVLAKVWGGMCS